MWGERSEHTQLVPRACQPGGLGQEEEGSSTYLCSSSSSSLDIIDLYWFPLSFPGLYLKENVSSAAGEGRQKKSKKSVNQRPPESHNQQQWACSLGVLSDLCSCTPNALATPAHLLSQLQSPESRGSGVDPRGEPRCCRPEDGRSRATASTANSEDC